jgi:hypothetical protein
MEWELSGFRGIIFGNTSPPLRSFLEDLDGIKPFFYVGNHIIASALPVMGVEATLLFL